MMNARTLLISLFILVSFVFAGNLTGTVKDMVSGNRIASAQAVVYDAYNVQVAQVQTASDGTFKVENITGNYEIRILKEGYSEGYFTGNVGASESENRDDLLLIPDGTLHVSVKDNASAFIQAGIVKVIQNGNNLVAQFNGPSGDIKVSPGNYDVIFLAHNYTQQVFHVSLEPAQEVSLTSSLEPTPIDTVPSVVSVRVELSDNSVDAGEEVNVTAVAVYNDMHEEVITKVASWNINGAGTLYLQTATLIVTKSGISTIEASFSGRSGSSQLNVNFGTPVSLDLQANPVSIYTDQSATLTSYLVDRYSNRQPTSDVTYATTCGSIHGSTFSSPSECTAQITAVYNPNHSLNDSITITVSKRSNSDSGSRHESSRRSSTSSTQSSSSSGTQNTTSSEQSEQNEPGSVIVSNSETIKFILPPSVYVGDTVTIIVLDTQSNPIDGIVISLERPDNSTISLVSQNGGKVTFVAYFEGEYTLKSNKHVIIGDTKIIAKPLPGSNIPSTEKPQKPITTQNQSSGTTMSSKTNDMGMLDAIFAAFTGEISIADAIKATAPLWLIIGAVLLAAAIFFVVYTFLLGGRTSDTLDKLKEQGKQLVMTGSEDIQSQEHVDMIAEQISEPKEQAYDEKELETEIGQLKKELRERMERLKQLKKDKGIHK